MPSTERITQEDQRADLQTRFKPGNAVWRQRRSHGRPCRFPSPESLRMACECYFEWCEDNPLFRAELVSHQGKATVYQIPQMRPLTLAGLHRYLNINHRTWSNYRRRTRFAEAVEWVEMVIYAQKLEGAAAGIFNPKIVMRDIDIRRRREQAREKAWRKRLEQTTNTKAPQ